MKSHCGESIILEPYMLAPPSQLWDHFNDDLIIDILELESSYCHSKEIFINKDQLLRHLGISSVYSKNSF